jgi:hypothetical protein
VNPLHLTLANDANAATLADRVVAHWTAIDAALCPIIGLYLSLTTHPWLEHEHHDDLLTMELGALRALLAQREAVEVFEASRTLFFVFTELLGSLVGASLAERLLGPLWTPLRDGRAAQDTSP